MKRSFSCGQALDCGHQSGLQAPLPYGLIFLRMGAAVRRLRREFVGRVPGRQTQGMSSSRREAGQSLTSLVSTSVKQACGSTPLQFAGLDERRDASPVLGSLIVASEECILARQSNCPFILPMSGGNWKFITVGILVLAARSVSGRCRSGLTVGISGCKFQLVRSW